jgi:diketogulonate reductase-like aldo/keto reductase
MPMSEKSGPPSPHTSLPLQNKDIRLRREDIWFTTKLKTNSSYDATRKAIKRSLQRSGLEYLDLYLLHSPYGGREKRRECWRAVEDAIEEGVVRCGGVSNFGVRHVSFPPILLLALSRPNGSVEY